MPRTCTLAIDVGGTFTDITFADAATGATWVAKTPSTPEDLSAGFITAVRKVLALAGRGPADVLRVFHGTTTSTNAILEGKTPPTALVTTAGFKYVLEIGRHDIPRHGNLYGWSKPVRPITPDRVFEVMERLDVDGSVLIHLDENEARAVARQLAQLGIPSVAVVFLHAYANPAHEQRMQAILAEEYPGVLVSLSSEVLPQFREFERSMATALNAAVMPPVSRYVGVLREALDAEGVAAPLLIMKSDGGVTSAATCVRQPVQTVLSGPAAGVVGAVSVGRSAGFGDIISIDARVARPLHLSVEEAAAGIVEIIDNAMARAIRTVSVGRGHDPRRFALVAFGGAGPLHACRLAELLDIPTVIVPPRPGVLSTWGLLDTDIRASFVRTVGTAYRRVADGAATVPALEATWVGLEAQARVWLASEQVPREQMRFERAADLRYEHQSFELTCPLGEGPVTAERLRELVSTFHAEHRRLYSFFNATATIELVTLRVTAIGTLPKRTSLAPAGSENAVRAESLAASDETKAETVRGSAVRAGSRQVYFRGRGFIDTPIYQRDALPPGTSVDGPAIIEQSDSTPLVAPGFRARVDDASNLLLERL